MLVTLYDDQADSVKTLSKYIEVDKAAISRLVEKLISIELVIQEQGKDRRSGHLRLSQSAQSLVKSLISEAKANELQFFGHLSSTELDSLRGILAKIVQTMPSIHPDGWIVQNQNKDQNMITRIKALYQQAEIGNWPFPQVFRELKALGVSTYRVNLATNQKIFNGPFGEYTETNLPNNIGFPSVNEFSGSAVAEAIRKHIENKTTYESFLKDIAQAGVEFYIVDMERASITYSGKDTSQFYTELIPQD